MEPLLYLDLLLVVLGGAALALSAGVRLRRPRRWTLPSMGVFFLGVGSLAAAVIDVGLWQREKNFRQSLADHSDHLRVGSSAPYFSLPSLRDGELVHLSDFLGRKPICLVLSSFN